MLNLLSIPLDRVSKKCSRETCFLWYTALLYLFFKSSFSAKIVVSQLSKHSGICILWHLMWPSAPMCLDGLLVPGNVSTYHLKQSSKGALQKAFPQDGFSFPMFGILEKYIKGEFIFDQDCWPTGCPFPENLPCFQVFFKDSRVSVSLRFRWVLDTYLLPIFR